LYVEDDRKDRSEELRAFLVSQGYELYSHTPLLFRPDNFAKRAENVFGNIASFNLFCQPRGALLPVDPEAFGLKPVPTVSQPSIVVKKWTSADLAPLIEQALRHHRDDNYIEAERISREVVARDPGNAMMWRVNGEACIFLDRQEDAVKSLLEAIRLEPNHDGTHSNLSVALLKMNKPQEAVKHLRAAATLRPDNPETLKSLGYSLLMSQSADQVAVLEEAVKHLRRALELRPDRPEALQNLGIALGRLGRFEEALPPLRRANELQPGHVEGLDALGLSLKNLGKLDEAETAFNEAIRHKPDRALTHFHLSLVRLLAGRWLEGWPEYEWRLRTPGKQPSPFTQPVWDGSPLEGKTVLLQSEQGLGDTINFVRYSPLVQARGGRTILRCQDKLVPLLRDIRGVDVLLPESQPVPPFDFQVPLLSLPGIFGTTPDTVPAEVPYLSPDPKLVERWTGELAKITGFKVGIAWQGSPTFKTDLQRSPGLKFFEPLSRIDDVRLISLQKGPGTEQLDTFADCFPVTRLGPDVDESAGAFMDTAAIIGNLDLVICSDSAVAHVAGALGAPVWVVLPFVPDWRWLLKREDSPWYPSMRLFRQREPGNWAEVFERVAAALDERVGVTRRTTPIVIDMSPGELIDKLTILQIKAQRVSDPAKQKHIRRELETLTRTRDEAVPTTSELDRLSAQLREVNESLWETEDELRRLEHEGNFGSEFIERARAVYKTNDRRAAIKREINDLLGSSLREEKAYQAY
jgi:Flp pilus assembly protein TadD